MLRAAMTLAVMLMATVSAWAQTQTPTQYISEVMLIGKNKKSEAQALRDQYVAQGWTAIDQDLNAGCGSKSDYIYLLYKQRSTASPNHTFITGFYISDASGTAPDSRTVDGRTYKLAPFDGDDHFKEKKGDLNSNAGGKDIHLYYTTESITDKKAVTQILFNATKSDAVDEYDLNKGAGGDDIYMHCESSKAPQWVITKNSDGVRCIVNGLEGEVAYPLHKMPYRGVDVNERENPRGAAIGGSDDHPQGGPITVYGGILSAICNSRGAGIGGGEDSYGGTFKVYGGNVKVERNVIDDKYGTQISGKGGAGIGGGYEGSGGDVHIYGGAVDVVGGEKHYAIGGYDNDGKGSIEIAANMRVTAGGYDYENNKATPDCVFTSAERVPAVQCVDDKRTAERRQCRGTGIECIDVEPDGRNVDTELRDGYGNNSCRHTVYHQMGCLGHGFHRSRVQRRDHQSQSLYRS